MVEAGGPLAEYPPVPNDHTRLLGIFQGDRVVGYWAAYDAVHAEPLWFHPSVRNRRDVVMPVLQAMRQMLVDAGIGFAFVVIGDTDQPINGGLAEKVGFTPVPGTLYGVVLDPYGAGEENGDGTHRTRVAVDR